MASRGGVCEIEVVNFSEVIAEPLSSELVIQRSRGCFSKIAGWPSYGRAQLEDFNLDTVMYSRQHLKPSTSSLGNNSAVRKVMTVQDMLTGPFSSCLFE